MITVPINHGHMFCGLGGGARGFNKSKARVGQMQSRMVCVGGVDVDRAGLIDFRMMSGVPGTLMDLFSRGQYIAFHGKPPPDGWREMLPSDVRAAYSARPHIMFLSAPCKGFSPLTSQSKSLTPKYQALNELTLRGIWLMLEAFQDDPIEVILFENVPRIQSRGAHLLNQIRQLLQHYGYAVSGKPHDCGELGGLAQSRKRFLLIARHTEKIPPFLYEPVCKPLRGVGEVLSKLPLPGDPLGGDLHRLPNLQWKTWVRLAFVEAGKDWRSLQRLAVEDGVLRDYAIAPGTVWHPGVLGVQDWADSSGTVTGRSSPTTGTFAVADPRWDAGKYDCGQYGVDRWDQTVGAVINVKSPGQGGFSVADPRVNGLRHNNVFRVVRFDETSPAITAGGHPTSGGLAVADPRPDWKNRHPVMSVLDWEDASKTITAGGKGVQGGALSVADPRMAWNPDAHQSKLRVTDWAEPNAAITGARGVYSGAVAVADPRSGLVRDPGDAYRTSGHYGVVPWTMPSYAVTGSLSHDNGRGNVADPRLPDPSDHLACVIVAEDGTYHRPFTTLDMGALQALFDPEEFTHFHLHGSSDSAHRERIGNAVPSDAAEAMGSVIARTLLLAWSGETFILSSETIWVRSLITALQCGQTA